jgi:hypothetical protein
MKLSTPERTTRPLLALGLAVTVGAAACSSSGTVEHKRLAEAAPSPNFVPQFRALGTTFLRLYDQASSQDKSEPTQEPFASGGKFTIAQFKAYSGTQDLQVTIGQLPSSSIDPNAITSIDITRYDSQDQLGGFDMTLRLNADGTVDADCDSNKAPHGLSEYGQTDVYDYSGSLVSKDPEVADAFLSDTLTKAGSLLRIAGHNISGQGVPELSRGDACALTSGWPYTF